MILFLIKFIKKEIFNILFCLLLFTKVFLIDRRSVDSGSMLPTIDYPSTVFIDFAAYGLKIPYTNIKIREKSPSRGDIIIFTTPDNLYTSYIKRIIGTPGDTITMKNRNVYINKKCISKDVNKHIENIYNEKYAHRLIKEGGYVEIKKEIDAKQKPYYVQYINAMKYAEINFFNLQVPKDYYFVMGDNRNNSIDSRYFGFIHKNKILGKYIKTNLSKHRI